MTSEAVAPGNSNKSLFSEEKSAIEALSNGAVMAVGIVAAVAANLIVFLALLSFANDVVQWFAALIGFQGITFEVGLFLVAIIP